MTVWMSYGWLGESGMTLFRARSASVVSNSNGVSFGTSGDTITASHAVNVSAGTTSNNLSAVTFSNSNNVTFGLNASIVTASYNFNLSAGTTSNNLNAVTFTHYRVTYRRTDGRNTEGVDVPYSFDSGVSLTVLNDTAVSVGFELVRSSAKAEAPLRALLSNGEVISTIATVTFYGHDQTNKGVEVTGTIGIDFANFADN